MKLQTQFTVPNKEFKDLDNIKKVDFLEETFNKFNENEKIKYRQFFQAYEINKYSRKNFSIIETLKLIF